MYAVKWVRPHAWYMVDPTSDLNEDVSKDEAPACTTCGTPLAEDTDHRVVTWVEDGTVETRHFCSDACRTDWPGDRLA